MRDVTEMTTEQLEELLGKVTPAPWLIKFRKDGSAYMSMGGVNPGDAHSQFDIGLDDSFPRDQHDATLIALAPSLARRVLAAEKLVEAIYDDASDQWWANVNKAATAYREASK